MGKILVVDDEFGIADLIAAVLTDEGHEVITAANGRLGLAMLANHQPDLMFLDFMMPVMDGAAVLRKIKSDQTVSKIPVVLMSSMPEEAVAERCSGYLAFLRKPFKIRDVMLLAAQLIPSVSQKHEGP